MNARIQGRAAVATSSLLLLLASTASAQGTGGTNAAGTPSSGTFSEVSPQQGDGTPWDTLESDRSLGEHAADDCLAGNRRVETARLVHPITAPNISEDPFITTDVRGTYIYHSFPRNRFFDGQAARVYDFQGRYAVTPNLQLFVNKLGAADIHVTGSEDHGITDLGLGFKYAVLKDWETHQHVSIGASFEFGISDEENFYDDDEARLFATFARRVGEVNVSGSANLRFGVGAEDPQGDSDNLSLHLHADYPFSDTISPVVELNYYDTLSNGENVTPYSGVDLGNFGGNEDEDVLTYGIGGEARLIDDVVMRAAYEAPLTDNEDLFGYRWTVSAIWRF